MCEDFCDMRFGNAVTILTALLIQRLWLVFKVLFLVFKQPRFGDGQTNKFVKRYFVCNCKSKKITQNPKKFSSWGPATLHTHFWQCFQPCLFLLLILNFQINPQDLPTESTRCSSFYLWLQIQIQITFKLWQRDVATPQKFWQRFASTLNLTFVSFPLVYR